MTVIIPDSHADLVDGPIYVALTTVMPDRQQVMIPYPDSRPNITP